MLSFKFILPSSWIFPSIKKFLICAVKIFWAMWQKISLRGKGWNLAVCVATAPEVPKHYSSVSAKSFEIRFDSYSFYSTAIYLLFKSEYRKIKKISGKPYRNRAVFYEFSQSIISKFRRIFVNWDKMAKWRQKAKLMGISKARVVVLDQISVDSNRSRDIFYFKLDVGTSQIMIYIANPDVSMHCLTHRSLYLPIDWLKSLCSLI